MSQDFGITKQSLAFINGNGDEFQFGLLSENFGVKNATRIVETTGRSEKRFPSYSPTRWWSILELMKTCVEEHLTLIALFQNDIQRKKLILSQTDIDILNKLINLMQPFADMSVHLSSESNVTASAILPLLKILVETHQDKEQEKFEEESKDLFENDICKSLESECAKIMLEVVNTRFINKDNESIVNQMKFLKKAVLLDPRFKNEPDVDSVKQDIKDELLILYNDTDPTTTSKDEKKQKGLAFFLKRSRETQVATKEELVEKEFNAYLNTPTTEMEVDPLKWWKLSEKALPNMSKLAKKYLCGQGTSTPSERAFSRGGLVVEDSRTLLTGEHVEQLVMISMNKLFK